MKSFFEGKKTYIMGLIAVIWAVYGWSQGLIEANQAQEIIWVGITTLTVRAAIAK